MGQPDAHRIDIVLNRTCERVELSPIWSQRPTGQMPTVRRVRNCLGQNEVMITTADGQQIQFDNEGMIFHLLAAVGVYAYNLQREEAGLATLSEDFAVSPQADW